MSCPHCVGAADFFGDRMARRDLKRYRKKGPAKTTAMLLDALREGEVEGRSLLDVGGGVGALQHELLEAGAARVLNVDASPAYQEAARREAERRGHEGRIEFRTGDLVELAPDLPDADLVTLDRVLCCYPDMPALVDATAPRARRAYGVVYPREHLLVRVGIALANLFQRIRRHDFRVYLHGDEAMRRRIRSHGLDEVWSGRTWLWRVRVFRRKEGRPAG